MIEAALFYFVHHIHQSHKDDELVLRLIPLFMNDEMPPFFFCLLYQKGVGVSGMCCWKCLIAVSCDEPDGLKA